MSKASTAKGRKVGREKKKRLRHGSPISLYVRGKITFDQYAKSTDLRKW